MKKSLSGAQMQNFFRGVCVQRTEFFPRGTDFSKTDSVAKTPSFNENTTKVTGIIFSELSTRTKHDCN